MANIHEIEGVFAQLDTSLRKFKTQWGVEFLARVKQKTPVRTGHLQNSWGFESKARDIEIYNTMPYAYAVEYGNDHMAPRAMMRTTLLESEQITQVAKQKAGIK